MLLSVGQAAFRGDQSGIAEGAVPSPTPPGTGVPSSPTEVNTPPKGTVTVIPTNTSQPTQTQTSVPTSTTTQPPTSTATVVTTTPTATSTVATSTPTATGTVTQTVTSTPTATEMVQTPTATKTPTIGATSTATVPSVLVPNLPGAGSGGYMTSNAQLILTLLGGVLAFGGSILLGHTRKLQI